jgi:hypothetical protein
MKGIRMVKSIALFLAAAGIVVLVISGAYWWSNVPPRRPNDVSSRAIFLWAGHLGLPAPKHGTWIDCWVDSDNNKCKLIDMNGTPEYEGVFLADTGSTPVPMSDLEILSEQTSQSVNLWVRVNGQLIPLVFLRDGAVLIPKEAYQEGMAKLKHLRQSN